MAIRRLVFVYIVLPVAMTIAGVTYIQGGLIADDLLTAGPPKPLTQQTDPDKIVFLNLRLIEAKLDLQSIKIVEGRLKKPKTLVLYKDYFYYKVLDETGSTQYQGAIPDPSRITSEYVDSRGKLQFKTIVRDTVHFSVRFPHSQTIRSVEFARIMQIAYAEGKRSIQTQKMGSFVVDLLAQEDEE